MNETFSYQSQEIDATCITLTQLVIRVVHNSTVMEGSVFANALVIFKLTKT